MINQKKKSDKLKAEIKTKMQNGMKLIDIFDYYPEIAD